MPIGKKIAELFVSFRGDSKGIKEAAAEAKQATDSVGESAKQAGNKLGTYGEKLEKTTAGQRKFAGAISSSVGAVTSLIGAVTAAVGVLTTFLAIGKSIGEELFKSKKAIDEYERAIRNLAKTIAETETPVPKGFERVASDLEEELDRLTALQTKELGRLNDLRNQFDKIGLSEVDVTATANVNLEEIEERQKRINKLRRDAEQIAKRELASRERERHLLEIRQLQEAAYAAEQGQEAVERFEAEKQRIAELQGAGIVALVEEEKMVRKLADLRAQEHRRQLERIQREREAAERSLQSQLDLIERRNQAESRGRQIQSSSASVINRSFGNIRHLGRL